MMDCVVRVVPYRIFVHGSISKAFPLSSCSADVGITSVPLCHY
jgi:hypothetical protein